MMLETAPLDFYLALSGTRLREKQGEGGGKNKSERLHKEKQKTAG